MKVKTMVLAMAIGTLMTIGLAGAAHSVSFTSTDHGVTVDSWTAQTYQGSTLGYDFWYKITNESTEPFCGFEVHLNTGELIFYSSNKVLAGSSATLHAWLAEFNPPQPTAQYWKGSLGDPILIAGPGYDAVAPILQTPQSLPEPTSLLLVVSGLLGVACFRKRAKI
jgi:hypothetical protein